MPKLVIISIIPNTKEIMLVDMKKQIVLLNEFLVTKSSSTLNHLAEKLEKYNRFHNSSPKT